MSVTLKILQAGHPVLRQRAQELSVEDLRSHNIQLLIKLMQETMYQAPGVGLAAPQIGESLQLIVIEDKEEYTRNATPEQLQERQRRPVPFHVLINPRLTITEKKAANFHEGCLSVAGFVGLVPRALAVSVQGLNEQGQPITIDASGWYARILQHEVDHLHGTLCIDHMHMTSFSTVENYTRYGQE